MILQFTNCILIVDLKLIAVAYQYFTIVQLSECNIALSSRIEKPKKQEHQLPIKQFMANQSIPKIIVFQKMYLKCATPYLTILQLLMILKFLTST